MKFFSNVLTAFTVIFLGVLGALAQTEDAVTGGLQSLTDASSDVQLAISKITLSNFPKTGTEIASGLGNLTTSIGSFTTQITPVQMVDFLTGSVQVRRHQLLLSTIIGKHSIAAQFFLTAPIAAALRTIEDAVDDLALALIGLIPTQQSAAQSQFDSLSAPFSDAISTFSS
ncbi:hypothetical protein BD309DRAFT_1004996 [Dichomitus squalens]|uniref:Hydrophobic surface binding protein A-domain-containing protein n=1 Tax=Dichomitus squalens TaxID=114155 RepID=A0A4Q9MC62_9APHY|nr:hypothetical protein BD311DRAFT_701498 [Dichomitus squalens]TBU37274.1 hypothetical protein BD309DRAFT_1004996 [Dichomitus squalens]TBU57092.1 hypothetical protein BD310DRAFT_881636 [Dichomitus squalens]